MMRQIAAQGQISQVVGKILKTNSKYVKAGEELSGELELVKLTNGQIWVREAGIFGEWLVRYPKIMKYTK